MATTNASDNLLPPTHVPRGTLTLDVMVHVLNGRPTTVVAAAHSPLPAPFLHPRWRFFARCVCRAWRDLIERPSLVDARTILTCWPLRAHADARPSRHMAWIMGRLVCASAIVELIEAHPERWSADTEATCEWFAMQANMARHHVFAALCAYGAPWAIAQALDHHWPRLIFAGDTSFLRHCDQVEYMRGTPQEFAASIAAMVVRRGLDDAAYALVERGLVSTLDVREALVGDHADLMERMILSGYFDAKMARDPSTLWRRAAKKRAVRCIERLMVTPNLAITPQPPLSPFAGRKRPRCHHTSRLLRRWQEHAIRADCYEMLQLCDRHGVEFRTATAIKQAAVFASMATLRWLWARGSRTGQAAHDCVSQQERLPRLEEVALFAVSEPTPRYRVRSTAVLHWLADELHYEPKDTRELLAKASRNNRIECGLYIMRRWPHRFTAVPVASVRLFFSACLARECSLWWVFRLVSHLERSRAYSPAALDLWSVLKSRLSDNASWTLIPALGRLGPVLDDSGDDITLPIGHVPSTGVHVKDNVIAAWKRLVSCMAVGECPSRADVRSLLDPPRPPVSLNTLCGVDCRVYFLGNEESCDDDDDIKCSDEKCNYSRRALERLALLSRWLTPHVH